MDCSTSGLPVHHHIPEFAQIHVHRVGDVIQPSHPLMPSSPSALIFPSVRVFSSGSFMCIRWPNYWSFSFSISPSSECFQGWSPLRWTGLISSLSRSLLQQHSLKASVLWSSSSFMIQLSQPYVTTGKTEALTIQTFVNRVMSLLFNTLSRFVTAFLQESNHFLNSWLQSASAEILEPEKRKSVTTSTFSPSVCHAVMGPDAVVLVFLIFSLQPTLTLLLHPHQEAL